MALGLAPCGSFQGALANGHLKTAPCKELGGARVGKSGFSRLLTNLIQIIAVPLEPVLPNAYQNGFNWP